MKNPKKRYPKSEKEVGLKAWKYYMVTTGGVETEEEFDFLRDLGQI